MHPFTEQLLREHNFIVNVTLVEPNTFVVDYAGKTQSAYVVVQENTIGLTGISCYDEDSEEVVYLTPYTVRLFLLCDIYCRCRELKLPYNIVKFFDKNEPEIQSNIMTLLPIAMTADEITKEAKLNSIADKIYSNKKLLHSFDAEARSLGIGKGLNIIKGLLV